MTDQNHTTATSANKADGQVRRSRRRKRTSKDTLSNLLAACTTSWKTPDYILTMVANFFKASSSILWIRDEQTQDEFWPHAVYNRPDLAEQIAQKRVYVSLEDPHVVASRAFESRTTVIGKIGDAPFDDKWLSKRYTCELTSQSISYISLSPMFDDRGEPFAFISLYFTHPPDISRLKARLPPLLIHLSALFQLLWSEVRLVRGERRLMGHEIRHATTSIKGSVDAIERRLRSHENYDIILQRSIADLRKALTTVLETAKSDKYLDAIREMRRKATSINFQDEFNSVAQPLIRQQPLHRISLSPTRYLDGRFDLVMAEIHFREIIENLISNAIKYSIPEGTVRATVSREKGTSNAIVQISNTSYGLSAAEQKKIWTRNYRGIRARESSAPGEGIGLTVVRDICEEYHIRYTYDESMRPESSIIWSNFTLAFPHTIVRWES
ncbi:sensor histidine kinase [Rhizobium alvei]|uniref:histidine kinase n=1 Tax=Rhizobium alvei TaxID=1132659 RepID=A0ABT8YH22_9HYPH|nr:HAMP domain-containing sensor histidine kinase [Rhizobium alvei]MDO6962973.1 HAMP domain-containing sensor histidine kinase [Rhizobium alvei]